METKSILESRRSWLNYGSIIALGLTAAFADANFKSMISETFGIYGAICIMALGAILNQYLIQTSDTRPTFQMPKKNKMNPLEEALKQDDDDIKDF